MDRTGIDLYWLPLGAGGSSIVRLNGRLFEGARAVAARRRPFDVYHAALEIFTPGTRHVVEIAPVPDRDAAHRGVVGSGAVGHRFAGRLRVFRYELRCWPEGEIPDRRYAVESPRSLTGDPAAAERMIALLPAVPLPVWGLDDLNAGEMWTSNSVIAWLIARTGLPAGRIHPPAGGCTPGWDAGLVVAQRAPG